MQILLTAAVLAVFLAAETGLSDQAGDANLRLFLVTAGMMLTVAAARIISGFTVLSLSGNVNHWRQPLLRFARLRQLHTLLWLGSAAIAYWALHWPRLVHVDWALDGAFLLDELLLLAPLLLPLALSWAAFYEVDVMIDRLRGDVSTEETRGRYVAAKFRTEAGMLLAPMFILLLYQDTLQLLLPETAWTQSPFAYVPLLLAVLAAFPWFVRWSWQAESLASGPIRERLENCAQRMGVSISDILYWPTNGRLANAAVCGFFGGLRYVLLSDELLKRLDLNETEAIFAHEIAHVKHHHLPLRLAALFIPFALMHVVGTMMGVSMADHSWIVLLCGAIYLVTIYAWYCRGLEHQADLTAASACGEPTMTGVEIFATALRKAVAGASPPRYLAMHPSIEDRIARLRAAPPCLRLPTDAASVSQSIQ